MSAVNTRDRILPRLIEEEMRESFIDYSMSVIVQRALPDVRDGLKPVHRRILYAMHEAGLSPNRPYKKSATVVGDVLGKYHPHGDSAVYDSLVRMVQSFSLRYPLIDGQGNFGSVDGDSAAAYRYTEARLAPLALEMLADIDKRTVDFRPNFDDRLEEPTVLPARAPNLLVNGSSGIAVGMSTNIPPHNFGETIAAALHLLDHPDCTVAELMEHIPGPDFPTGGMVVGSKGIRDAYETGRGRVVMRARVLREERRGGREQLVVTEIPYGTNKSRILEQIADLAKRGRVADVSDLRDESDREGIRMVIELKRGADPAKVAGQLFKWTSLQTTFGVISLALDSGVPREFTLKALLERFRDHRIEVTVRRSRWELERARAEAHILEGLLVALGRIDETIRLIRSSRNRETAARKLEKEFKLAVEQSAAILAMRLSRLTALETREVRDRLTELAGRIRELEAILASPERQLAEVRAELHGLGEAYSDPRRTRLVASEKEWTLETSSAGEDVMVAISREGFAKQVPMALHRRRADRGVAVLERDGDDTVELLFAASTEDTLLVVTEEGHAYGLGVGEIPEAAPSSRGRAISALLEMPRATRTASVLLLPDDPGERTLFFATTGGVVKRTPLEQHARHRAGGADAMGVKGSDRLLGASITDGLAEVVLVSAKGRAIRFAEGEVSITGRGAQGVRGIRLRGVDEVCAALLVRRDAELFLLTERGWGKRTAIDDLPLQARGGLGSEVLPVGRRSGPVVAAVELLPDEELEVMTRGGRTLRLPARSFSPAGRGDDAEPLLELEEDTVVSARRAAGREPARAATVEQADADGALAGAGDDDGELDLDLFGETAPGLNS